MATSATPPVVASALEADFPCTLSLHIPFPTPRLASIALQSIRVDEELSPLVRRTLTLAASAAFSITGKDGSESPAVEPQDLLHVQYRATTNRMLRVAVNGFFESLGVVLSVMRELDVDVVGNEWIGDAAGTDAEREDIKTLKKVQGVGEVGVL